MTEALQVQRVPAASLVLDEENVRVHGKRNLEAIRGSLRRFGQVEPLVVQKGTRRVLAGNGRLVALRELGVTEVDIVEIDVQAGDAAALAVALNRTAELAGWDYAKLKALIDETAEIDWDTLGWSEAELRQALLEADIPIESRPGQSDPDEVPEPPVTPITQPGDLWILTSEFGEHRVLCGDATSPSAVQRLLRDVKPFLMVTDPPYGVDYTPEWRDDVGAESPNRSRAPVAGDAQADWKAAYALFPGDVAYVWHASLCSWIVAAGLHEVEFEIRAQIVWCKPSPTFSRGAYHWQHEPAWYAVRKGKPSRWGGDRRQSTTWEITPPKDAYGRSGEDATPHATQKPIECMERPIRNHGGKADAVYDPFLGSGTTLLAAERQGRRCFGIEIEPKWVDVAVARWEKYVGKKAVRQPAGA